MIRVALIGCGKTKAARSCMAQLMYRSQLFRAAHRYAVTTCDRYFILSAKHGLLSPTAVISPYELSLSSLSREERATWGRRVGAQLDVAVPELDAEIVFLAGEAYSASIDFEDREFYWEEPLKGLGIGERLRWLKANTTLRRAA